MILEYSLLRNTKNIWRIFFENNLQITRKRGTVEVLVFKNIWTTLLKTRLPASFCDAVSMVTTY